MQKTDRESDSERLQRRKESEDYPTENDICWEDYMYLYHPDFLGESLDDPDEYERVRNYEQGRE